MDTAAFAPLRHRPVGASLVHEQESQGSELEKVEFELGPSWFQTLTVGLSVQWCSYLNHEDKIVPCSSLGEILIKG